ncbi:MAG: hypothetical protein KF773_08250 [Deltaproteobacteria bacterium]|nr:hypothetical protein [Deltaproteobacteria bacterium]MCW5806310.1 hypothetical protein [Deltaproteobacteria bacterium]
MVPAETNIHSIEVTQLTEEQLQWLLEDCERAALSWLEPQRIEGGDQDAESARWMRRADDVRAEIRRRHS